MKIIRCLDVETSSVDDPPASAVCEIGWQDVAMTEVGDGQWKPSLVPDGHGSSLLDPGMAIDPRARAIHHISDSDIAGKPPLYDRIGFINDGCDFFAAHSSAFERKYLGDFMPSKPWICTLKAARRVWPTAPAHGLQVLRYYRLWPLSLERATPCHRAGPDAYVGAWLLVDLIQSGVSVRDMVQWEREPSLLPGACPLKKHRGTPWADVPADYLEWIVGVPDMNDDIKHTARHWLAQKVAT